MCGRYVTDSMIIKNAIKNLEVGTGLVPDFPAKTICPGTDTYIITDVVNKMVLKEANWGFPGRSGLVINARSESVMGKPMFENSFRYRRCIIPCTSFFEWDSSKTMATFTNPVDSTIYLAGLWNMMFDKDRFIILTVAANDSVINVHDRMPLMINHGDLEEWIYSEKFAMEYLKRPMPSLEYSKENEQLSILQGKWIK